MSATTEALQLRSAARLVRNLRDLREKEETAMEGGELSKARAAAELGQRLNDDVAKALSAALDGPIPTFEVDELGADELEALGNVLDKLLARLQGTEAAALPPAIITKADLSGFAEAMVEAIDARSEDDIFKSSNDFMTTLDAQVVRMQQAALRVCPARGRIN